MDDETCVKSTSIGLWGVKFVIDSLIVAEKASNNDKTKSKILLTRGKLTFLLSRFFYNLHYRYGLSKDIAITPYTFTLERLSAVSDKIVIDSDFSSGKIARQHSFSELANDDNAYFTILGELIKYSSGLLIASNFLKPMRQIIGSLRKVIDKFHQYFVAKAKGKTIELYFGELFSELLGDKIFAEIPMTSGLEEVITLFLRGEISFTFSPLLLDLLLRLKKDIPHD